MCLEYLHAMLDVGVLSPQWNKWTLNQQKMEKLTFGTDLIELVLARLNGVRSTTREILTWAAIMGGQFNIEILEEICRRGRSDIENASLMCQKHNSSKGNRVSPRKRSAK